MCSATHRGFRVLRSKAEVVERVGWRSEIGPGKPYWRRPLGSTGGMISLKRVRWVGAGVAVGAFGAGFFCERDENNAAVNAAPEAAEMPAMIAKVVFDMAQVL